MFDSFVQQLRRASTVALSTRRHCHGNGPEAQLALRHGLQQLGKQAVVASLIATAVTAGPSRS